GGKLSAPDVVVRSGPDTRLRSALFDQNPAVPSTNCTAITIYPHASDRPRLGRRILERLTF
ncbi:MAG: hypothetical protein J07HR59_01609, partial [Halorubrum sp. J07HR59]